MLNPTEHNDRESALVYLNPVYVVNKGMDPKLAKIDRVAARQYHGKTYAAIRLWVEYRFNFNINTWEYKVRAEFQKVSDWTIVKMSGLVTAINAKPRAPRHPRDWNLEGIPAMNLNKWTNQKGALEIATQFDKLLGAQPPNTQHSTTTSAQHSTTQHSTTQHITTPAPEFAYALKILEQRADNSVQNTQNTQSTQIQSPNTASPSTNNLAIPKTFFYSSIYNLIQIYLSHSLNEVEKSHLYASFVDVQYSEEGVDDCVVIECNNTENYVLFEHLKNLGYSKETF